MSQPQVTIIICTYQRTALLARAIEAALNQWCDDFLIHVFGDASQDETSEVVKKYQQISKRVIKYTQRPHNVGSTQNYTLAFQEVQTPFFCFTADDDFILPNFVESHLEAFKSQPDIGVSIAPHLSCFEQGEIHCITIKSGSLLPWMEPFSY